MSKATQHPDVSGLYSLLLLSIVSVGPDYFELPDKLEEKTMVLHFLEELVPQCTQFQDVCLRTRFLFLFSIDSIESYKVCNFKI
jgi:hypothetical protein